MTETLKRAVHQVEQLPPEEQDKIAAIIERELADRRWEALFASEASDRFLDRLESESQTQEAAGSTQDSTDRW
jgi:hypothetical protein